MGRHCPHHARRSNDDGEHLVVRTSFALSFLIMSILLTSVAQLVFRFVMQAFDLGGQNLPSLIAAISTSIDLSALGLLTTGLALYALSMLCWILALVRFEVSQAYPAMAIGYVVVYFAAVFLPGLNESISAPSLLGVSLIVAGVILIAQQDNSHRDRGEDPSATLSQR